MERIKYVQQCVQGQELDPCGSLPTRRDQTGVNILEEIPPCESDETLAQVAQRSRDCPIPGSVQGQVGRGLERPGIVDGVPGRGREVEFNDLGDPFQRKPFYDAMKWIGTSG